MQQDEENSLYATMRPARGGRSLVTLSTYEARKLTAQPLKVDEYVLAYICMHIFVSIWQHNSSECLWIFISSQLPAFTHSHIILHRMNL